ncbi:MAG: hypothetical protein WA459_18015 [Stellaceae bacterium]
MERIDEVPYGRRAAYRSHLSKKERDRLKAEKLAKRQERHIGHPSPIDPTAGAPEQFPSNWPDAPEDFQGIARTLSRDPSPALANMGADAEPGQ